MITEGEVTTTEVAHYVVGSNAEGVTVLLEKITESDDWTHRVEFWSDKPMSAPYHHDVHIARRTVTTVYERV